VQTRLEEKASENASLQRQLDSAILDIKRHKEQEREHIALVVRCRFSDALQSYIYVLHFKNFHLKWWLSDSDCTISMMVVVCKGSVLRVVKLFNVVIVLQKMLFVILVNTRQVEIILAARVYGFPV